MRTRLVTLFILALTLVLALVVFGATSAATGDPVLLNEILASHTGTDDTEFFELYGTPGLSLDGLSVIVVEGDASGKGAIDLRIDLTADHALGSNGFFLIGNCAGLAENYAVMPDYNTDTEDLIENNSLTAALVETSSITGNSVTGSEVDKDTLGLSDGGAGDTFYFGAPVIGPDGSFFPAGGRRVVDGVDTDLPADWVFADFGLGPDNTPTGGGVNGCEAAPEILELTIPEIQGDGQYSPYVGKDVVTMGVVTLVSASGRDMWIQDPEGDGDPATSDGIQVDDRQTLTDQPVVGDMVKVTGTVQESQFGNALPLTLINNPVDASFEILSSGNSLPDAVGIEAVPKNSIADAIDFWEAMEGMLVAVENAPVVAPTTRFGEFGMLTKYDAKPGSGFFPQQQQILLSTEGLGMVDYNPERILVDDASLDEAIIVRPGDRVRSLTGVVDYTFGMYKLQPAEYDIKTHKLLPAHVQVSSRSSPNGNVVITTYNVENLFDLENNPDKDDASSTPTAEELAVQLSKLALSIERELELPDIMVLQEVENTAVAQELANIVNAETGTAYMAASFETSDARGIEVAFVWDTLRVEMVDVFQLTDAIVPGVSDAFGPPPLSPSGGREPLVGMFLVGPHDDEITIVGNHFKSKSGDDPPFGVNDPFQRPTEVQRKMQAQVVRDYINQLFEVDANAPVMVAGDLNDFQFSEPEEGPNNPVAIIEGFGDEVAMYNLINLEKEPETFSFVFDGNTQLLDHMLVSPALLNHVQAADLLHFNVSYPAALHEVDGTAVRAADHDPLEGRFNFR
jgi:predicted extracellular nuclease